MLKTVNLANLVLGIDMLSDEAALPKGACRDAVNVDFNVSGGFRSRSGFTKRGSLVEAHSLVGSRDGTFGFYAQADRLQRLVVQGGVPMSATVLSGLTPSGRMSFFEYADQMFFTNGAELGMVTRTAARLLGVPDPVSYGVDALSYGTLVAGKYSVAYSLLMPSGEESGLSEILPIELTKAGGFTLTIPPVQTLATGASAVRIYATSINGDLLYLAGEFAPRMGGSYDIVELKLGKQADNVQLHRMPAGSIVRAYNGRIMVARAKELWFSEPYRYGLTSRRHNFVSFNSDVVMVEPVVDGVYVGVLDGAVYFLRGPGPSAFDMNIVSTNAPTRYASCLVQPSRLPRKIADSVDSLCALWLGSSGYSVGQPGGTVKDVQADRISLEAPSGATLALTTRGVKQAVTIVESGATAGPGLAVDSII